MVYTINQRGEGIPFTQVANLKLWSSNLSIDHFNKIQSVSVSAFVDPNNLYDHVIDDILSKTSGIDLPDGYSLNMWGEYETRQE